MVEGGSVHRLYTKQLLSLLMVEESVHQLYILEGGSVHQLYTATVSAHGRTGMYINYIPHSYCLRSW